MAHFFGEMTGRGNCTVKREGTTASGLWAHMRGWDFGIVIDVSFSLDHGCDAISLARTGGTRRPGDRVHVATLYEKDVPPEPEHHYCVRCGHTTATTLIVPARTKARRIE